MCLVFWHLPTWLYCRLKKCLPCMLLAQAKVTVRFLAENSIAWLGPHKALGKNVINSH